MPSYSKIIMIGHLVRDPELRHTPKGSSLCSFTLAINRRWKEADSGQQHEETSFVNCLAFAGKAEAISQWVRKGDPLLVEGHFKEDTWEDKTTGAKRSALKVVCEQFVFLTAREGRGESLATNQNDDKYKGFNEQPPF